MIVRCINNSTSAINDTSVRDRVMQDVHQEQVGLRIGECYPVFGIAYSRGAARYLICEDTNDDYPTPHHAVFFEVVDGAIGDDWAFSATASNVGEYAILPRQWASDALFLEKLVDGEAESVAYFELLKQKLALPSQA